MTQTHRTHITRHPGVAGLETVEDGLADNGVPPALRHLIKLRVSQINGCALCVRMHSREARDDGETQARLDDLVVWRQVPSFTAPERAALAWAEALTTRGGGAALAGLHGDLEAHFGKEDIAALTMMVVMINSWNRLQIAVHNTTF